MTAGSHTGRLSTRHRMIPAFGAVRGSLTGHVRRILTVQSVKVNSEELAADLCGVDSTDMSKRAAIAAIVANF